MHTFTLSAYYNEKCCSWSCYQSDIKCVSSRAVFIYNYLYSLSAGPTLLWQSAIALLCTVAEWDTLAGKHPLDVCCSTSCKKPTLIKGSTFSACNKGHLSDILCWACRHDNSTLSKTDAWLWAAASRRQATSVICTSLLLGWRVPLLPVRFSSSHQECLWQCLALRWQTTLYTTFLQAR